MGKIKMGKISIGRIHRADMIQEATPATKELKDDNLVRFGCFVFAVLLVVTAVYCRIRLLSVPLERDEGGFAYIGQQLLHGIPPYVSGNMKILAGIHFAYSLIMALFGESATGIHEGLLLVNSVSMVLLYILARRILPIEGATVATGVFALLSVSQSVLGIFSHATHFVMLFVMAGLIFLLAGIERNRCIFIFISGICLGFSVLMKQHGVFFCLFAFGLLVLNANEKKSGRRTVLILMTLLASGMLIPYLATCLYMVSHGVFTEFWFWTVTRSLDYATASTISNGMQALRFYFNQTPQNILIYWYLAGIGLVTALCPGCRIRQRWFVIFLLMASAMAIIPGLAFYPHYFVLLLPALSLLAGVAIVALPQMLAPVAMLAGRRLAVLALLSGAMFSIYQQRDYLFTFSPEVVSRMNYGLNPFPESIEIARYIRENSASGTQIAVFGSEPQIYFYANRPSATDYLYMYPLVEEQPHVKMMQNEMISEIELASPEFIVFVGIQTSWMTGGPAGDRFIGWANNYMNRYYRKVGMIDLWNTGPTDYYWGKDAENRQAASDAFVVVLQRNW